jgi:hypothetical protein
MLTLKSNIKNLMNENSGSVHLFLMSLQPIPTSYDFVLLVDHYDKNNCTHSLTQ